jgi:hypothetical protein
MRAAQMVMDESGLTDMTTVHALAPDAVAVDDGAEVQPPGPGLRKAPLNHAGAGVAGSDDPHSSVAGEEDPGAALDLLGPAAAWPVEGSCPWPKESPA